MLRFENDIIGVLDINWLTPTKVRELSVIGERGMFVANYLTQDLVLYENDSIPQGGNWHELAVMGVSEGRMIRFKVNKKEPLRQELGGVCERGAHGQWRRAGVRRGWAACAGRGAEAGRVGRDKRGPDARRGPWLRLAAGCAQRASTRSELQLAEDGALMSA